MHIFSCTIISRLISTIHILYDQYSSGIRVIHRIHRVSFSKMRYPRSAICRSCSRLDSWTIVPNQYGKASSPIAVSWYDTCACVTYHMSLYRYKIGETLAVERLTSTRSILPRTRHPLIASNSPRLLNS